MLIFRHKNIWRNIMSKLKNGIATSPAPTVDARLSNITMVTTCAIPEKIVRWFSVGFEVLADQMEHDKISVENLPNITCIMIKEREFTIELDSEQRAIYFTACVYPITEILPYDDVRVLMIFLEEFVHLIWNIKSERDVCFKVHEIVTRAFPDVKIDEIYNMDVVNNIG
jgi:hypothetical protein